MMPKKRTDDIYAEIIKLLAEGEMVTPEIAWCCKMSIGSVTAIMARLVKARAVSRRRVPHNGRWAWKYTRLVNSIKREDLIDAPGPTVKYETPKGGRIVSFDSPDMQRKLAETVAFDRRNRKSAKVHVSGSTLTMLGDIA